MEDKKIEFKGSFESLVRELKPYFDREAETLRNSKNMYKFQGERMNFGKGFRFSRDEELDKWNKNLFRITPVLVVVAFLFNLTLLVGGIALVVWLVLRFTG